VSSPLLLQAATVKVISRLHLEVERRWGERAGERGAMTLFEAVGGSETFERLVERFYVGVAEDKLLRPLYPADLEAPKRRLTLFLIQLFGGPQTYSEERGHPRLRQRHLRFPIDAAARDAWLRHMAAALDSLALPAAQHAELQRYFDNAATFLMNQPG
jgi:hemoglobin